MKPTAQQLNEWLTANGQDAIKTLEEQGMTLRFVEGPENWWQEYPSLAVESEGVGFSFQCNSKGNQNPARMLENAIAQAPSMHIAYASARQQYGDKSLPMDRRDIGALRGETWDICNHQTSTNAFQRNFQEKHWRSEFLADGDWDAAQQVQLLCERQVLLDGLQSPKFVLALVRSDNTTVITDPFVQLTCDNGNFGFNFQIQDDELGCSVTYEAFYRDEECQEYFGFPQHPEALLSEKGIDFQTDYYTNTHGAITAKDLNMDPLVMNTMADMGVAPLDILRFDAQKAEAESSAGEDYLQSLDGDIFASDSTEQGLMR